MHVFVLAACVILRQADCTFLKFYLEELVSAVFCDESNFQSVRFLRFSCVTCSLPWRMRAQDQIVVESFGHRRISSLRLHCINRPSKLVFVIAGLGSLAPFLDTHTTNMMQSGRRTCGKRLICLPQKQRMHVALVHVVPGMKCVPW